MKLRSNLLLFFNNSLKEDLQEGRKKEREEREKSKRRKVNLIFGGIQRSRKWRII